MASETEAYAVTPCTWAADIDGNWETACGEAFFFENGGPKENGCRFCSYCGKPLHEVPYQEPDYGLED